MVKKISYEALQRRNVSLEIEMAARDNEIEKLRKAGGKAECELINRSTKLTEGNPEIKPDAGNRMVAEKDLKASQHLLQTLMDTIEGEAFIKDAKGTYLYVNKAFGKDFDVDPGEVIGNNDYFVFSPELAAKLQENDQRIMGGEKAINIEERGIVKGKEVTFMTNKVPMIDDEGNVLGLCGVGFDITRQKQMEKALKKSHAGLEKKVGERTAELSETVAKLSEAELRYRTVADFTYDWEFWTKLDGTLNYVSPSCERITGYTPRQFMDKPSLMREIILPQDQEIWESHFHDARKEHKSRETQFRIRHRDGAVRWIEHACQPVIGDQGELLGFRASNRDITKRMQGEIQLQHAYSEIKDLKAQLEADQTYLLEEIKLEHDYENIIGDSEVMQYVLFRVQQIAQTDTTVLIQGETGTGKELIARAIHNGSSRRQRPLVKVDCASLPANLIESELFGHEKGAFTHAMKKRVGRFELANGATIFLDEIGELPLELQSRLLRVIQDGEFERLGSSRTIRSDVRVIAATNRDLEADIRNKKFRMDLWYRLNVYTISMPPLRERGKDIALLVEHMTHKFARKLGKRIRSVPSDVIAQLRTHSWPGNVRELENVINRAVINTQGDRLQLEDAPDRQQFVDKVPPTHPIKPLKDIERDHIMLALRQTNWKLHGKDGAAALLDINPSTLRGRMRKQGIRRPSYES